MNYSAITIIYNPNSTGSSEALAKNFKQTLKLQAVRIPVSLQATKYAGHAEELAYTFAKKTSHALIISSSGDGGYHEVINGVMQARKEGFDATAGLLPAGNANDHYRNLHTEQVIDFIKEGNRMHVDLLTLTAQSEGKRLKRYGHSYIGFGLTPSIGKELNKNKLTIFNEAWIVGRALFNIRPVKLKIKRRAHSYDSIIFSNVDTMSKYLKISRPSRVNDGKFEVTIFRKRNKLKLILLLLKTSLVGIKEDYQVKKFKLSTIRKTLVQIDGEIFSLDRSKVVVGIEKQSLPCVI